MTSDQMIPMSEIRRELTIVNSRFISTLAPVSSVDAARSFITRIKQEFADASHHVPAYVIGGGRSVTEYCSDDGEPSGTAGRPVLAVLRGSGLGDVAVVVTRYFGGTLLGTGGLVKAYTESSQLVVNEVQRGRRIAVHVAMASVPYNLLELVRIMVGKFHGQILGEEFGVDVRLTYQVPVSFQDDVQHQLQELSLGKLRAQVIETTEKIVPLRGDEDRQQD